MSLLRQRHSRFLISVAILLLACQLVPMPTATPTPALSPTPTSTANIQPKVAATATHTPTVNDIVTASPTPTASPTATQAAPPAPPLPTGGPLPAIWTTLEFGGDELYRTQSGQADKPGKPFQGIYYPTNLALDAENSLLYALGRCAQVSNDSSEQPLACISVLDLETDQVQRRVEVQASDSGNLLLAGDTLYLNQPWRGELLALDRETLAVRQIISDVQQIAFDGQETVYAVTLQQIMRLEPAPVVSRPLETDFSDSTVDMAATADYLYVLGYESLRIFSPDLDLLNTISLRDHSPRDLLLTDETLYIGCGAGIIPLDIETNQLGTIHDQVKDIQRLVFDAIDDQLYALSPYSADWFGKRTVFALDAATWHSQTLLFVQEGWLADLALDQERGRLLVLDTDDHALLPISLDTAKIAPRLPLGIEVGEVIADEAGDRLYVSASDGWVRVLNRRSYAEIGRVYGGRYISLDAVHGCLYAGDPRMPTVTVFDTKTLKPQREIAQSGKPRANPATGQVIVIGRRFQVFDGQTGAPHPDLLPGIGVPPAECAGCYYTIAREVTVDAQRGMTATITYTPWPGKPGPQESIAYDPTSGHAYYALLTGGYAYFSSISLYSDLRALQTRTQPGGSQPILSLEGLSGYLALDPLARRLYVVRGRFIFVLDSETLQRIGVVDATDNIHGNWVPIIAAVDGDLGRLYSPRESQLVVWTRTGGALPAPLPPIPAIVTGTVTGILPSPNFAQDQTLLATIDSKLCRSTDGGKTWRLLRGGLPDLYGEYMSVNATFSPDYAHDETIWAGIYTGAAHGEGIWRSTDGGDTWQPLSSGIYDLRVHRIVPSPNFANDRTLLAYSNIPAGEAVYRSTNSGQGWQVVLRQTAYNTPSLPRPEEFFGAEQYPGSELYRPQFQCNYDGTCQQSDDGGKTWDNLDTGSVKLDRLVDHVNSPHSDIPTVYFLTESNLYRYWIQERIWEICTLPLLNGRADYMYYLTDIATAATADELHPNDASYDLFIGSYNGEFLRFAIQDLPWQQVQVSRPTPVVPTSTPTGQPPTPTPCVGAVDEQLKSAYEMVADHLGCATAPSAEISAAIQPFEVGLMIWRSDIHYIYVLSYDATWKGYQDTWEVSQPDHDPEIKPPEYFFQPMRGFGKVWREQLGGTKAKIGWATDMEQGYTAVVQPFTNGVLIEGQPDSRLAYALFDNGTWGTANMSRETE